MDSALIAGLAAFGPKYLETMYEFTAGNAAICFGMFKFNRVDFQIKYQ